MKAFNCACGQRVFFENTACGRCGRELGFDPAGQNLVSLNPGPAGDLWGPGGTVYRHCRNRIDWEACNWLIVPGDGSSYCVACRLNEVIPDLQRADNLILWRRLESAKRRLVYTLLKLGLPLTASGPLPGMRFRFLEDRSRNPGVAEEFVTTGHASGVITLNVAEADNATRQLVRDQMRERYRTLLGHFRHESGHYYFPALVLPPDLDHFRELFGDERAPYQESLQAYYDSGPPADWESCWVSAYASAHPLEDWAESFAHYLHIIDALETGRTFGVAAPEDPRAGSRAWILEWGKLSVILNEINRSLGLDDPYPFVLPPAAIRRLEFIHRLAGRGAR